MWGLAGCETPAEAAHAKLEARGIDYTTDAFREAASKGDLVVVKLFVESGMSVNATDKYEWPALHWAAAGRLEVVKYLVGRGADVNARNDRGRMALHWAAFGGYLAVVEYLVEVHGADVNATGYKGATVLHGAAYWGRLAVVRYLVENKAEGRATDENGKTPRDVAEGRDRTAVVEYLDSLGG